MHVPPSSWCTAKFITIHVKGDTSDPGNFLPIELTSAVSKLFHKVIAYRLEQYIISNDILDTSLQKGFLRGVNGCMEHIFAIQSILTNAKDHSLPLSMSFIDLKNAFGSGSYSYIMDMLHYIKLPKEILTVSTPRCLDMLALENGQPQSSTSREVFSKEILYTLSCS